MTQRRRGRKCAVVVLVCGCVELEDEWCRCRREESRSRQTRQEEEKRFARKSTRRETRRWPQASFESWL